MEDSSLVRFRRRAGRSEGVKGCEGFLSVILRDGLLLKWDGSSCRYKIVVPTALRVVLLLLAAGGCLAAPSNKTGRDIPPTAPSWQEIGRSERHVVCSRSRGDPTTLFRATVQSQHIRERREFNSRIGREAKRHNATITQFLPAPPYH
ncbi:unnamed protein product [Lampetra fluviatilis]